MGFDQPGKSDSSIYFENSLLILINSLLCGLTVRWLSFLSTVLANNLLDEPDDEEEIDKPARIVDILVQLEMDGDRRRAGDHGELVPDVCQEELRPRPTRLTSSFPLSSVVSSDAVPNVDFSAGL